jgi:hypothetical protein
MSMGAPALVGTFAAGSATAAVRHDLFPPSAYIGA